MQNQKASLQAYLLLIFLSMVWGSSFLLMKKGMVAEDGSNIFSPYQVAALRMGIAGLALLPFMLIHRKEIKKTNLIPAILVGLCGNGIPAFLFTYAETGINTSLAGMLNATTPVFTVLIAVVIFKNKFLALNYVGVFLGFIGALMLVYFGGGSAGMGQSQIFSASLVLIACFLYGTSVNIMRNYLYSVKPIAVTAFSLLSVGIPCLIFLFTTDYFTVLAQHPGAWKAMGFITILSLVGTALSVVIFYYLIRMTSAVFASSVTYLIPVTAMFLGVIEYGEVINIEQFAAIGVIFCGVWLINKKG
jgi:drug/metabolite transporter (DMT)-like permease